MLLRACWVGEKGRNANSFSSCLLSWAFLLDFWLSWTEIYTLCSPGSWAFRLGLEWHLVFTGSLAHRWHIVEILCICKYVSQFHIINPCIYKCMALFPKLLVLFLYRALINTVNNIADWCTVLWCQGRLGSFRLYCNRGQENSPRPGAGQ